MWDLEVPVINSNCRVQRCSFLAKVFAISPLGDCITVGLGDGSVVMYSIDAGVIVEDDRRLLKKSAPEKPLAIEYTSDSMRVVCGTTDDRIFI